MKSRYCRWLIVSALIITASGAWAQQSAPPATAQAALPSQKSNAQKLLLDSVRCDKLDVTGVKTALNQGADPNQVSGSNSVIGTLVSGSGCWQYEHVAKPEQKGVEILQVLLKAGAGPTTTDDYNAIFAPVSNGYALFTEVLLDSRHFSPTREIQGMTPMEIAARYGRSNMIELLQKHGAAALEPKEAAQLRLIGAAGDHDIPGMEDAIDAGADVNVSTRQGETALVEATSMMGYAEWDSASVLYLLKKGADPTIQGSESAEDSRFKTTALHLVIQSSSYVLDKKHQGDQEGKDKAMRAVSVIKALLQHGALVSARDYYGQTPLHIAAKRNNVVGAQMLIDAGCKMAPLDQAGKSPLDYAESAEMIKLLKDHGAKEQ
jgi:ankyrin repeat protein